jgi:hypothetical protein
MNSDVKLQLHALNIRSGQPLLICDADEILFEFMTTFLTFLDTHDLYYDWQSIALTGNVRSRNDKCALSPPEVRALLSEFFEHHTGSIPSVPGAAKSLRTLESAGVQIVILSNLPLAQRETRIRALRDNGMDYGFIANKGLKGPTVRALFDAAQEAPTAFIDDIPNHHDSVSWHAKDVHRLHFSAHERLRALQRPEVRAHAYANDWPGLEAEVRARLSL